MSLRVDELLRLRVHVETCDDRAIVRLIGPIAAHDVGTLRSALERAEASGAREIVVDLRLVPVLCSSGVSALLIGARRLGPERRLVLARPCEMVRRVCEVTGLTRFAGLADELSPELETKSEWADDR
jgi:anti-anti-sigma factor